MYCSNITNHFKFTIETISIIDDLLLQSLIDDYSLTSTDIQETKKKQNKKNQRLLNKKQKNKNTKKEVMRKLNLN